MPVFVTGATGFLGVNLVRALVESGETVRALVRSTSDRQWLDPKQVECVTGDVSDIESIRRAMVGCDRAYHVAGWVQITPWGVEEARRVNVTGTDNVCRVCAEMGVRLVHTSSIAAVGHGPLDCPATEETAWNFQSLRAPYYDTKREGEDVVHGYIARGLNAVIVNPGYLVGPFDVRPTSGAVIIRLATRKLPIVPSRGGIAFVDVREAVEGMTLAMAVGRTGERYILAGENLSYIDYARLVCRIAGVKPPRIRAPFFLLWPSAWLATLAGRWRPDAFTEANLATLRTAYCDQYLSGAKALRELGLRSRPIDQAVADALEWFEEHAYLSRTPGGWSAP
jgi:dihydroflavonol-4-reductase